MRKNKYLIIGQGIAGTMLSMQMGDLNIDHAVVDDPSLSSSSKVAAGILNPIVLKRLKKVADSDKYLEIAKPFYKNWEKKLGEEFFFDTPIHHVMYSHAEQNSWLEKSENPAFAPYLGTIGDNTYPAIKAPLGLGQMTNTGWVDTNKLIRIYRNKLQDEKTIQSINAEYTAIEEIAHAVDANRVVLCNGHLLRNKTPFLRDIFSPTRGELLIIKSNDLPEDRIFHAGVFILPLGNKQFKVGATYDWDQLMDTPTEIGRNKLESELMKFFTGDYTIIDHQAGVRPNIRDRKPLLGEIDGEYIFNGLGSRGALMAPYLAQLMIRYMEYNDPIPDQYDIQRFS